MPRLLVVAADIAACLAGPLRVQRRLDATTADVEAEIFGLQYRGFVGASPVVAEASRTVMRVASAAVPVLARGRVIGLADLPRELREFVPEEAAGGLREARRGGRARAAGELDRALLVDCLGRADGNVSRAAKLAGYSRAQFYRLIDRYKVTRPK